MGGAGRVWVFPGGLGLGMHEEAHAGRFGLVTGAAGGAKWLGLENTLAVLVGMHD